MALSTAAIAVATSGVVVMCGWYAESSLLVQVRPNFAPMQFNTALGFTLSGIAIFLCIRGSNRSSVTLAIAAGLLGAITLAEYGTGVSLAIDDLFVRPFIVVGSTCPGRMAPNTAVCFTLISAALVLTSWGRNRHAAVPALLAAAVFSAAVVSIGGYIAEVSSAYTWGRAIPMAIHTSIAFAVISAALIAYTWKNSEKRWPDWSPVLCGLSALLMSILIWQSLTIQEQGLNQKATLARTIGRRNTLQHDLTDLVNAIERMAARESTQFKGKSREAWVADVAVYRSHFTALDRITLYGADGTALASSPSVTLDGSLRLTLSPLTESLPHVTTSCEAGPDPDCCEVDRFSVILPMDRDGRRVGYLSADCRLQPLIDRIIGPSDGVRLSVVNSTVVNARPNAEISGDHYCGSLRLADAHWGLMARLPQSNLAFSVPILLVLVFGSLQALLLALTTRLLARNREHALCLRDANERLQLAIFGGNIGIWEWEVGDEIVVTSPEYNAQLGETPGTLSSKAQLESRLHPSDRDQAKKVVQECLDGLADCYESIFRLRHANGSYRRILSRGRVYRDANGQALRMAGTHADITQQRDLEQLFHAVFNESVQFMGILSPSGLVIDANRAALKTAGVELNDVLNRPFWETPWWSHSPQLQQRIQQSIAQAAAGSLERFEATYVRPDDREIHADFSIKPVCDLTGDVVYLIAEGRDVPEYCTASGPIINRDAGPLGNHNELRQALDAWTDAAAISWS